MYLERYPKTRWLFTTGTTGLELCRGTNHSWYRNSTCKCSRGWCRCRYRGDSCGHVIPGKPSCSIWTLLSNTGTFDNWDSRGGFNCSSYSSGFNVWGADFISNISINDGELKVTRCWQVVNWENNCTRTLSVCTWELFNFLRTSVVILGTGSKHKLDKWSIWEITVHEISQQGISAALLLASQQAYTKDKRSLACCATEQ